MLDLLTQHCHKRKGLGSTWTADQSDVIADYLHIGLTCVVNVEKTAPSGCSQFLKLKRILEVIEKSGAFQHLSS